MKKHSKTVLSYEKTTHDVRVVVTPLFIEEESKPEDNFYLWAYQIRIENLGKETLQLTDRFWEITDANGISQTIYGAGVVGEQPVLKPGDTYQYTSTVPLSTTSGFMRGNYLMSAPSDSEKQLEITIPTFSLDSPYTPYTLN